MEAPVQRDVFLEMEKSGARYGYIATVQESISRACEKAWQDAQATVHHFWKVALTSEREEGN